MSYTKEELTGVKCDNCGELYTDDSTGFSFWLHEDDAYEAITSDEWHETDDKKHYCPDCHEIDDDDNLIIKTKQ